MRPLKIFGVVSLGVCLFSVSATVAKAQSITVSCTNGCVTTEGYDNSRDNTNNVETTFKADSFTFSHDHPKNHQHGGARHQRNHFRNYALDKPMLWLQLSNQCKFID
jgi:hypothetical protein